MLPGQLETFARGLRGADLQRSVAERAAKRSQDGRLIIDDQQHRHSASPTEEQVNHFFSARMFYAGSVNENTAPPSRLLSPRIVPPCASVSRLQILNPSPIPVSSLLTHG